MIVVFKLMPIVVECLSYRCDALFTYVEREKRTCGEPRPMCVARCNNHIKGGRE